MSWAIGEMRRASPITGKVLLSSIMRAAPNPPGNSGVALEWLLVPHTGVRNTRRRSAQLMKYSLVSPAIGWRVPQPTMLNQKPPEGRRMACSPASLIGYPLD